MVAATSTPTPWEVLVQTAAGLSGDDDVQEVRGGAAALRHAVAVTLDPMCTAPLTWPAPDAAIAAGVPPSNPCAQPSTTMFDVAACPGVGMGLCALLRHTLSQLEQEYRLSASAAVDAAMCARPASMGTPAAAWSAAGDVAPPFGLSMCVPPLSSFTQVATPSVLAPLLSLLGPHLANDLPTFSLYLRCLQRAAADLFASQPPTSLSSSEVVQLKEGVLVQLHNVVLPVLSLCGSNVQVSTYVWEVLRFYAWPQRYQVYTLALDAPDNNPSLHAAFTHARARATHLAQSAMKRISKETYRKAGRALSKTALSNPLPVVLALLADLEVKDNFIPLVMDALRYSTPLTLDVLTFGVLQRLTMERARVGRDEVSAESWLTSLATFIGTFYSRFAPQELGGLWHHLLATISGGLTAVSVDGGAMTLDAFGALDAGSGAGSDADAGVAASVGEIHLLRLFMNRLTNFDVDTVDMSDDQLLAYCGGELLRRQYLSRALTVGPVPGTTATAATAAVAE
ncbi:MAG: hypothetical protein EOO41_03535, partial [Methanobacteriota archaeon]